MKKLQTFGPIHVEQQRDASIRGTEFYLAFDVTDKELRRLNLTPLEITTFLGRLARRFLERQEADGSWIGMDLEHWGE